MGRCDLFGIVLTPLLLSSPCLSSSDPHPRPHSYLRMEVGADQVKAIYVAAARLKMERVVNYCAQFLVDHLDPATAIEIRALPGIQRNPELAARVDAFLAAEV